MFKSILVGGCLAISLLLSPAIAYGQASSLNPEAPTTMATGAEITPIEVQQFVQVLKRWKDIEQDVQRKIVVAIKAEKMNPQRFMEIVKAQDPQTATKTDIPADDLEKFKKIVAKIQEMEQDVKGKKEHAITAQGLTIERFNQIGYSAEQNPSLKQKVKQMLGE